MSTEINQLMGEIIENPDSQVKDIEQLLSGFLNALLKEQAHKAVPEALLEGEKK